MKYINDTKEPELLGVIEDGDDLKEIKGMVARLNVDLCNSGFKQHQYYLETVGQKAYIRKRG